MHYLPSTAQPWRGACFHLRFSVVECHGSENVTAGMVLVSYSLPYIFSRFRDLQGKAPIEHWVDYEDKKLLYFLDYLPCS